MKIVRKLLLTGLCLFMSASLFAQSQKQHTVHPGETIYGIARKYEVSPNDIIKANPEVGSGDKIRPGQVLVIPAKESAANTPAKPTNQASVHSTPVTTTQEKAQVENTTPPATTTVAQTNPTIPPTTSTQNGYLNTGYKEMYRIQRKDNLYRIALAYNLTIEELVEANPGLTTESKLKKGEFLYIPYSKAEKQAEMNRLAAERAEQERLAQEAARKAEEAAKRKSMKKIKVGVVLPLKDSGDRGNKMIEMYRGILMAVDSIKHLGTSVEVHAYHSGSSALDLGSITSKPEFKDLDVIFGPLNNVQANILTAFCHENKIRLVMPFATTSATGKSSRYVFQASVNSETALNRGIKLVISRFSNANYIFMQTGVSDERGSKFSSELKSSLASKNQTFKTLKIEADEAAYAAAFSASKRNIIIPDGSSLSATNTLAKKLRALQKSHPEYSLTMVGYPEWPSYVTSLLNDFYALDTYVYCTFFRNPNDTRVTNFEALYRRNFKSEVSHTFPRYGLFGFDLAYYFLKGMSMLGDFFEDKFSVIKYNPLQNGFDFEHADENSSYANQQVMLIHYTTSQRIEIIK